MGAQVKLNSRNKAKVDFEKKIKVLQIKLAALKQLAVSGKKPFLPWSKPYDLQVQLLEEKIARRQATLKTL